MLEELYEKQRKQREEAERTLEEAEEAREPTVVEASPSVPMQADHVSGLWSTLLSVGYHSRPSESSKR